MKVFHISSLAKYFYTKTVLNYNLEYANFETRVSNYNIDYIFGLADISSLFPKKLSHCYIKTYLLLETKREFHILIILFGDVWVVRMTPAPRQHAALH